MCECVSFQWHSPKWPFRVTSNHRKCRAADLNRFRKCSRTLQNQICTGSINSARNFLQSNRKLNNFVWQSSNIWVKICDRNRLHCDILKMFYSLAPTLEYDFEESIVCLAHECIINAERHKAIHRLSVIVLLRCELRNLMRYRPDSCTFCECARKSDRRFCKSKLK